ncbi:hypothetical protein SAY87_025960 [Trapa incisa]|uniref:Coronatine-insensitive protein 1 n=1 Tax=Trapa incisa TaxID=236973 RepID=A0AAN7GLD2_9MYRT|nr:hypothetical protein SAY87_025960 [Trapa incisa]
MEDRNARRQSPSGMPDEVLSCMMPYIKDPRDRAAASLVSRRWHELDALTRKHVKVILCYAASPDRLTRRFKHIESLKVKGKPRAAMFNLIPEDWGGFAGPWIKEISRSFDFLKRVHFRRMIVSDLDLEILVRSRGHALQALKLDKCSGFSTDGLLHVTSSCRNLRILFLEESLVMENDGEWLHMLSLNNTVLETLNFYMTDLMKFDVQDLERIVVRCKSLVSLKISECDILNLTGLLRAAPSLEEFAGGSFDDIGGDSFQKRDNYTAVSFPRRLCSLGLTFLGNGHLPILFPCAAMLKRLDLLYAMLDTEGHCLLIQRCPNLEVLETRDAIGNRGLEVLAQSCPRLRRLRIERGADDGLEFEEGVVTQTGLMALAQGCLELEYLAIYVCDITNQALEYIGTYSKNLCDFRLVLLDRKETITDLPLDDGVRVLLRGCNKLRRFALYLRHGGLTDQGLSYIGRYSPKIRWILLGHVGETDKGLLEFSRGCPSLQKLEMRGCCFSEKALAQAVKQLVSLRYLWVQGYTASKTGRDLLEMARPYWNIELIRTRRLEADGDIGADHLQGEPSLVLAYSSLAGPRSDFPRSVVPMGLGRLLSW